MKNLIVSLALCFCFSIMHAQEETPAYQSTVRSLQEKYNEEDYEAIFDLYSDKMKQALPLPNTISFFEGIRAQAGKISQSEFIKFEEPGIASYKTTLGNGIFNLLISLNDDGQIAELWLKPFEEPREKTTTLSNNLLSAKSEITQEQAEIIFNKINSFPDQTQLAIAIIKNGEITYFGAKREKDTIIEVNNEQKVFEIGSISKVFTSTLLADLVIEGKIKLDEPINKYLGLELNKAKHISFLTLANHSSGLPRLPSNLNLMMVDPLNPYAQYDEAQLQTYLKESIGKINDGNTKYEYSNLGAGLLAYVLAEIEMSSYEEMLQERIFAKYEMHNSTTDKSKIKEKLVTGLDAGGNEVPNWDFSSLKGAGAILSTTEDLSKFAIAQYSTDNKELKLTQESTLNIDQNMDIGLGWHLIKDKNYLFHNGGTGGYCSSMVLDPTNQNGVIILSNVSAFHPEMRNVERLSFELMETLK